MEINKRIEEARKSMKKHKVDTYIVTSSDYHQSEYIGGYFQGREYLSGFTGSASPTRLSRHRHQRIPPTS